MKRFVPLALAFALAGLVPALPALAADPAPAPLGSTVFEWSDLAVKSSPKGEGRFVADAPTATLEKIEMHVTTLNPGYASHPPHHHPQEEILLIRDGTVETSINGEKKTIGAGSMVFFASHDLHNLTNKGTVPSTYYVLNFYTQATAEVIDKPAASYEEPALLHSSAIDWSSLSPVTRPADVRRQFVDSASLTYRKLEVHETTLAPGTPASTAHRHPWLQLIVIRKGTMEITIDGKTKTAEPGSIVYLASNALQNLRNSGTVPLTYWVLSVTSDATPKPAA